MIKKNKIIKNSEGVLSKNEFLLESFAEYCIKNPSMRFWQALLNWSGFPFICISPVPPSQISQELKDTYYLE